MLNWCARIYNFVERFVQHNIFLKYFYIFQDCLKNRKFKMQFNASLLNRSITTILLTQNIFNNSIYCTVTVTVIQNYNHE